jgi:hypothetical protein
LFAAAQRNSSRLTRKVRTRRLVDLVIRVLPTLLHRVLMLAQRSA